MRELYEGQKKKREGNVGLGRERVLLHHSDERILTTWRFGRVEGEIAVASVVLRAMRLKMMMISGRRHYKLCQV